METKICKKCNNEKKLSEFWVDNSRIDGLCPRCKVCESNRIKDKYHNKEGEKERIKYKHIERRYGLTKEEYLQKLNKQGCQCEICKVELKNDIKTHIDHNHKTGKVRGILCKECNHILGWVKDDINRIQWYINYLNKYNE